MADKTQFSCAIQIILPGGVLLFHRFPPHWNVRCFAWFLIQEEGFGLDLQPLKQMMLFTCLKLLQTNCRKYATSFNVITTDFLGLPWGTMWKIDISIEIKLLFAVTEFKPDMSFGSYTGHAVILSFSFRPQLFLLWLRSKYSWALSHWFCQQVSE